MNLRHWILLFLFTPLACDSSENPIDTVQDGLGEDYSFMTNLNIPPRIKVTQQQISNGQLEVQFNISDIDNQTVDLHVFGWNSVAQNYTDLTSEVAGDKGTIQIGTGKSLRWTVSSDYAHIKLEAVNESAPNLQDLVDEVSLSRIQQDIIAMDGVRHYQVGAGLLSKTRDYIEFLFMEHGVQASRQAFSFRGAAHENVIGTIVGKSEASERYQISAHFDTVGSTPGADDNASGTAGVLEAMRILSLFEFDKTVDFLAFDLEEAGLVGSSRYVANIGRSLDIKGLINFEMIGYTCRSAECEHKSLADTAIYNIAPPESLPLQQAFQNQAARYAPGLKTTAVESDNSRDFRRSDHVAFWDNGFQALFLTDGANFRNPHYHQPSDQPSTIDYDFATNIVKTTVATIAQLAGWRDRGKAIIELN